MRGRWGFLLGGMTSPAAFVVPRQFFSFGELSSKTTASVARERRTGPMGPETQLGECCVTVAARTHPLGLRKPNPGVAFQFILAFWRLIAPCGARLASLLRVRPVHLVALAGCVTSPQRGAKSEQPQGFRPTSSSWEHPWALLIDTHD